jgi:hypothetical protein
MVLTKLYENGPTGSKSKQRKHRNIQRLPEVLTTCLLITRQEMRLEKNKAIAFFKM